MSLPSLLQALCHFPKSIWQLQQEDTVKGTMVSRSSLMLQQLLCFLRGWHQGQEGHRTPPKSNRSPSTQTRLEKIMFSKINNFSLQRIVHIKFSSYISPSPYFIFTEKKNKLQHNKKSPAISISIVVHTSPGRVLGDSSPSRVKHRCC